MTEELHKLGEVLRAARESKGVDLARVERDTKIRTRYLSALERGEYRDLPGAVYTKGFLRNYAHYLGLDPEYLTDLYRLETNGAAEPAVAAPPRPMRARRARALVVTPGAIAAATERRSCRRGLRRPTSRRATTWAPGSSSSSPPTPVTKVPPRAYGTSKPPKWLFGGHSGPRRSCSIYKRVRKKKKERDYREKLKGY